MQRMRLLVFASHEAWVYQLAYLGCDLDIVVGLTGRYTSSWDTHIRPIPPGARLVECPQVRQASSTYDCIITHNITDLLDVRERPEPKVLVLHIRLQARLVLERAAVTADQVRRMLGRYVELTGTHVVAVSRPKGQSWGFTEDVVPFGIDPDQYRTHTGELACGLRVANFILQRPRYLAWELHQEAFGGLPVRIVGHNPGMPGVGPSDDWDDLKDMLARHRFFIHTADPDLEDGYNMATVEAMAAGMPVLGNRHPDSPVEHGVSGFLSDDPRQLRRYAQLLLADRELALQMGMRARQTACERFGIDQFKQTFLRSIQTAIDKHRRLTQSAPPSIGLPVMEAVTLDQNQPRTRRTAEVNRV